jgi:hypothetical protein
LDKYTPEEDFEKGEYSKLIEEIRSIKKREPSEKFDENFYSRRRQAKFKLPLGIKLIKLFNYLITILRLKQYRYYYAAALSIMLISISLYMKFFQKSVSLYSETILTNIDTLNKSNENIASNELLFSQNDNNKNDKHYWNTLYSEIEKRMNYRYVNLSVEKIMRIIYSGEFRKRTKFAQINNPSNKDTIEIVIRILKSK